MAQPFGQASGGAFGAKPFAFGSPSPGLFGGSTPAFGAASTPAVSFGGLSTPAFSLTPPPATSTLGSSFSTPAAATAPGGLFGSTAPATTPNPFGTATPAFGQTPAQSPAPFSGFSFAPAAASSAAPSPFGVMPSPAAQPAGMFGQTTQMAPVAFTSGLTPDTAVKELQEIRAAYTPNSPAYKFQYLFLNVVDNPAQRVKPNNLADEMRWRQVLAQAGGPNNPDKLWPVLALGFKDLLLRASAQNAAIEENQQRLKALSELSQRMSRQHMVELKRRTGDVQRRHVELSNRLLHVTRMLDALESRLASSLGYQGDMSQSKEQELSRQLSGVEAEVSASSLSGLQRRLEAVTNAARLRSRSAAAAAGSGPSAAKLDEKSLQQLFAVLKEHAEGVKHLQEVLKRDQMDLQIIRQQGAGRAG